MNKKIKIIINIALVLSLVASLAWWQIIDNLNSWGGNSRPDFWEWVFAVVIPAILVGIMLTFNILVKPKR